MLFVGMFIGSIFAGPFADRFGRRLTLIIATLLETIIGAGSAFLPNFASFVVMRTLLGVMIGFTNPIAVTYTTEISTTEYRGKSQVLIQFFFVIGALYSSGVAKIFLGSFGEGNWQMVLVFSAVPSLVSFLGLIFYCVESPRFYIASSKYDQGIEMLNKMKHKNKHDNLRDIAEGDKGALIDWKEKTFDPKYQSSFSSLFIKGNLKNTINLSIIWFGLNFIFYGLIIVAPKVFEQVHGKDGQGLNDFIFTLLGEPLAIVIAILVIDRKGFARRNTTLYSLLLGGLFYFSVFSVG